MLLDTCTRAYCFVMTMVVSFKSIRWRLLNSASLRRLQLEGERSCIGCDVIDHHRILAPGDGISSMMLLRVSLHDARLTCITSAREGPVQGCSFLRREENCHSSFRTISPVKMNTNKLNNAVSNIPSLTLIVDVVGCGTDFARNTTPSNAKLINELESAESHLCGLLFRYRLLRALFLAQCLQSLLPENRLFGRWRV